jgi:hypothetical protein
MKANHKNYFDCHPDVNTFFFTTDGLAFRNKGVASGHQRSLTGKTADVETVKREVPKKVKDEKDEKAEKLKAVQDELAKAKEDILNEEDEKKKEALELRIVKLEVEIENLK